MTKHSTDFITKSEMSALEKSLSCVRINGEGGQNMEWQEEKKKRSPAVLLGLSIQAVCSHVGTADESGGWHWPDPAPWSTLQATKILGAELSLCT